jgi:uncharacterized peroxidase-related enzyme
MGQVLMNGPSPLTPGEREMIQAYVAGLNKCRFSYMGHCAAAEEWGIASGLIDKLLDDPGSAPVDEKLRPLLSFVKKLTLTPSEMSQSDADAVFAAGWDEKALHDTIAVTARMNFMNRLVEGYGFTPMDPARVRENAARRKKHGYVNMYPSLTEK